MFRKAAAVVALCLLFSCLGIAQTGGTISGSVRDATGALIPGASPAIVKESRGASVLVRLSEDPFLTTFRARLLCAQHNIEANF